MHLCENKPGERREDLGEKGKILSAFQRVILSAFQCVFINSGKLNLEDRPHLCSTVHVVFFHIVTVEYKGKIKYGGK